MGRLIGAVLAGYAVIVVGFLIMFAIAFPGDSMVETLVPSQHFMIVSVVVGFLLAIAGGYVCALIARRTDMNATYAFLGLWLVMSIISFMTEGKGEPLWYSLSTSATGGLGIWLGSRLRHARPNPT